MELPCQSHAAHPKAWPYAGLTLGTPCLKGQCHERGHRLLEHPSLRGLAFPPCPWVMAFTPWALSSLQTNSMECPPPNLSSAPECSPLSLGSHPVGVPSAPGSQICPMPTPRGLARESSPQEPPVFAGGAFLGAVVPALWKRQWVWGLLSSWG